jgi:hypothetical protein
MKVRADLEIRMKKLCLGTAALAVVFAAVGCQENQPPPSPPTVNLAPNKYDPPVDAGWKNVVQGPLDISALKAQNMGNHGQSFASRNDPFALLREEKAYDISQTSERFLSETPFRFDYEEPPPPQSMDIVEPQPYRRLAGVIVGESVLALIDMGDGRLEIIRPGQRIPNSEWTVVSIDEEKAVLRRGGNRLPRQIVVRLESPPFQGGGGGATPGGGGGNRPGGFGPGGGGRPGGAPGDDR